jgi:hypothetical protein
MLRRCEETPTADHRPPAPPAQRWSSWPLAAVVAAFAFTRISSYFARVRFDASSLPWFWQFIDPALLKTDLAQSRWHLHGQPPAFHLSLRQTQPVRYYLRGLLNTGWFLVLAYVLVFIPSLLFVFRPSAFLLPRPSLFFLWFNVAWMTFVANVLEAGVNNRFRFVTDPLVFALLAAVAWLRRRDRGTQPVRHQ